MDKKLALERVKALWDAEGYCDSCGWHAMLSEYGDNDEQLMDAIDIDSKGRACLSCLSKDDPENWSHRGVRISI